MKRKTKESIAEKLGFGTSAGGGVYGIIKAVIKYGKLSGKSGPALCTGLRVIGKLVGGGMLTGIGVSVTIPVVTGVIGYYVVKGICKLI